jgi:hypothetical protein
LLYILPGNSHALVRDNYTAARGPISNEETYEKEHRSDPLEPGIYYVAITNVNSASPCSYTVLSRGIGPAYSVPVVDVPFSFGIVGGSLRAREAAWYRVEVPSNSPAWKAALSVDAGGRLVGSTAFLAAQHRRAQSHLSDPWLRDVAPQ